MCSNLPRRDVSSKSDPFAVIYVNNKFVQRTESIEDNHNPKFVQKVYLDYKFSTNQVISIKIFDRDKPLPVSIKTRVNESEHDLLCTSEVLLAYYLKTHMGKNLKLKTNSNATLEIYIEEVRIFKEQYKMMFQVCDLPIPGFFSKLFENFQCSMETDNNEDFRLVLNKMGESGWVRVIDEPIRYKNSFEKDDLLQLSSGYYTDLKQFSLTLLTSGDYSKQLELAVYSVQMDGEYHLVNKIATKWLDLIEKQDFVLDDCGSKEVDNVYKSTPRVTLVNCSSVLKPSFCDFLKVGVNLNLILAVDFTASNVNPIYTNSLHYINPAFKAKDPQTYNDYQKTIFLTSDIILHYDYDKYVPMYGFGAFFNQFDSVSHCFPMTEESKTPNTQDMIFEAYNEFIKHCNDKYTLSQPTNFQNIIDEVCTIAQQDVDNKIHGNYYVLVILTDGAVTDMKDTLKAIVDASRLPVSLAIVGIGKDNFDRMDRLDGDGELLKDETGRQCVRDCVQFVPLNDYILDQQEFTSVLLSELPTQVEEYYNYKKIKPEDYMDNKYRE